MIFIQYSDAILLIYNSEFHSICSTRLNYKTVSFHHINTLIADTLVNLFLNKKPLPTSSPTTIFNTIKNSSLFQSQYFQQKIERKITMHQLIQQLCPLPQYKLLSLKFVPQV